MRGRGKGRGRREEDEEGEGEGWGSSPVDGWEEGKRREGKGVNGSVGGRRKGREEGCLGEGERERKGRGEG